MKKSSLLIVALLSLIIMGACGKKKVDLTLPVTHLNSELRSTAAESPMFLTDCYAEYEGDTLAVNIKLIDPDIKVSQLSQPLIEFITAIVMKDNTGTTLDEILNGLTENEGIMVITITDVMDDKQEYPITPARLKQLVRQNYSELNFAAVRSNVNSLLEARCEQYAVAVGATECTYRLTGGFAEYTLTFERASAFANQTQGSLNGKYLNALRLQYTTYGECDDLIQELMEKVGIDGYRFVYMAEGTNTGIRTTGLTWRSIN